MSNQQYIQHFGVRGMKWGHRKAGEDAFRSKLSKIEKNGQKARYYANQSDMNRFKYRNRSLSKRVGGVAAGHIAMDVFKTVTTQPGGLAAYSRMSKPELAAKLTVLALKTASGVAMRDALAKSAADRYTDEGKKDKTKKQPGIFTKEDVIEGGVNVAAMMIPVMYNTAQIKYNSPAAQDARAKKKVDDFMKDISPEKFVEASYRFSDRDIAIR